jgi:hypothetical protein
VLRLGFGELVGGVGTNPGTNVRYNARRTYRSGQGGVGAKSTTVSGTPDGPVRRRYLRAMIRPASLKRRETERRPDGRWPPSRHLAKGSRAFQGAILGWRAPLPCPKRTCPPYLATEEIAAQQNVEATSRTWSGM